MPTAFKQVADNAFSTTTTDLTSSGVTSLALAAGTGQDYPLPGNGFWLTLWDNGTYPGNPFGDPDMEKVLCSARSTDTVTIGATQKAHLSTGTAVALLQVAQLLDDIYTAVNTAETNISTNATAISTETTRAEAAESTLTTNLSTEVTNRQTAITGEASTRSSADTTLQTNITAETSRAETAEALLLVKSNNLSDVSSASTALNNILPSQTGNSGKYLETNGTTASWETTSGGSLTIGTTTITSGTSGRILYDNGGVVGEVATTGSGNVVLASSPTLVTPNLGTPSAINLSNATGAPTWNQNTTGTASNLSGTPTVPNGTAATTQSPMDNSTKLATTAYTDLAVAAAVQGLSLKDSVVAATTGGETYTILSGNVTVIAGTTLDGQSPSVGDRILIKDAPASTGTGSANSTEPGNGIYTVTANVTNLAVSRSADMSGTNAPQGAFTFVEGGTANNSSGWVVSNPSVDGSFTYGTNNIKWTQFSGAGEITNGTGLGKSGNTLSVLYGTTSTTAAVGNDSRITGALQASNNLSDLGTVATARTNLGLGSIALLSSVSLTANVTGVLPVANGGTNAATTSQNYAFMGPTSGSGAPSFRAIVAADIPTLNQNTTGSAGSVTGLSVTSAKTLTVDNSITLAGTDSTTMTFPGTSATIARTDAAQTFTGVQTFSQITANLVLDANNAVSVTSNAGTCSANYKLNTFTNSSSASMTITLSTSTPTDGQIMEVRIYDHAGTAEAITWVNTENSSVNVPATSNGSTTSPLSCLFQWNGQTNKWRFLTSA